jgi:RNA polymerase sigma-70 factor (ECF subfamily)
LILPHLGAAYSVARWMMQHSQDAEDAVQESVLKAYRSFGNYAGGHAQAWLLAIVRNTCLTALERRRSEGKVVVLVGHAPSIERIRESTADPAPSQDSVLVADEDRRRIHAAISALPLQFREVLVMREYHDLSYREIAEIVGAPVGTVMSRLSRARERLAADLADLKTNGTERSR